MNLKSSTTLEYEGYSIYAQTDIKLAVFTDRYVSSQIDHFHNLANLLVSTARTF